MHKCPKCGADVPKTWLNKRRQTVGKCPGCGKLVILERGKKEVSKEESKKTGDPKASKRSPSRAAVNSRSKPPAKSSAGAKEGKRGAAGQPAGKEPAKRSIGQRISEWWNAELI